MNIDPFSMLLEPVPGTNSSVKLSPTPTPIPASEILVIQIMIPTSTPVLTIFQVHTIGGVKCNWIYIEYEIFSYVFLLTEFKAFYNKNQYRYTELCEKAES